MKTLKEKTQLRLTIIVNLYNRGKLTLEEFTKKRDEILKKANASRT